MNKSKRTLLVLITAITAFGALSAGAATIPAGSSILVKTSKNIYARDPAGRKFDAQLAHRISGAPAGSLVQGVVKSPWFSVGSTTRPLTLRLTEIVVGKHVVPIKTD